MCCFTSEVEDVSDTCIFARMRGDRQLLVYEMQYSAKTELAMVLPIPVVAGAAEDAVRFVSLEHCTSFFKDLRAGFRLRGGDGIDRMMLGSSLSLDEVSILEVHSVGSFEASFVPTPADFGRLDERFRLPADLWLSLNTYRDYGFAVFKLKPGAMSRVHPMAFEFPTRDPKRLFFPTLHIHDRRVGAHALFDHELYCQPEHEMQWHLKGWEVTLSSIGSLVKCDEARALLDLELPCWRHTLKGQHQNCDTWLGKDGVLPAPKVAVVL